MDFTIRQPSAADAPRIAELQVATWRETYAHLLPEGFFDDAHIRGRHEMWNQILAEVRDELLWVAKENPRAIAFYLRNGFEFDGVEQIDPLAPMITDARMVR